MEMFECGAVGCSGEGNELTVVVEYETDLEGGAYEVGVAPEGSPGLERLVSEARGEADALVGDEGGWAAVRIGLGDVESIDCESGRTMYVVGEGRGASRERGHAIGVPAPAIPGMPRAIPAPLRAKGLLPLGTLLKATRGRVTSFGIYALAVDGLLSGIYTL